jgi:hypothetical protein
MKLIREIKEQYVVTTYQINHEFLIEYVSKLLKDKNAIITVRNACFGNGTVLQVQIFGLDDEIFLREDDTNEEFLNRLKGFIEEINQFND